MNGLPRIPVLAALAALSVSVALMPARGQPYVEIEPPVDPFPIRRVLLPPDRLDAALIGDLGVLRRMPREEFEAKVRAAADMLVSVARPPRVIEARYRASLIDGAMTGTAEWSLAFPGGPGVVALDPLRPAVRSPRWAGERPAVLYRKAGGIAELLADDPADSALVMSWDARATSEPGVERFDLGWPPAPLAVLDLDLPADRAPTAEPPEAVVSGPYPGRGDERRNWRVTFGGIGGLSLAILRTSGTAEPPPLLRSARSAKYTITPHEVTANFEFAWESIRGPVGDLAFRIDPGLRVTGVTTQRPTAWIVEGGADPRGPNTLRLTYRGPLTSGTVTVTATADYPVGSVSGWPLPAVRLLDGLFGPDTIEVRTEPELQLIGQDPGSYRVVEAGTGDDRVYRVLFTRTVSEEAETRSPVVRFREAGPTFNTTEEVTWRPGPIWSSLVGRFRLKVGRGPLSEIPFEIPPGFAVRAVTVTPDDPGVTWSPGARSGLWLVEPSRPIGTDRTVDIRVEAFGPRGPRPADPAADPLPVERIPFPQLGPVNAAVRTGTFKVVLPAGLVGTPYPLPPEAAPVGSDEETATFVYPYRVRGPAGILSVGPGRPRIAAETVTLLSIDEAGATATAHMRLRCLAGRAGSVTLFLPDPTGGPADWDVRSDTGDGFSEPPIRADLAVLAGTADGWSALGRAAISQAARGWVRRVVFPRGLSGGTELRAAVTWPSDDHWPLGVPIPSVGGAAIATTELELDPSAAGRFEQPQATPPADFPARWTLHPRGSATDAARTDEGRWQFADTALESRVGEDGRTVCELSARVVSAGEPLLPVTLPAGAELLAATLDGHTVDPSLSEMSDGRLHLHLPLPDISSEEGLRLLLRYRLPPAANGPVWRFRSPSPELPDGVAALSRRWAFATEFRTLPALRAQSALVEDEREEWRAVRGEVLIAAGWSAALAVVGLGWVAVALRRRSGLIAISALVAGLAIATGVLPPGWRTVLVPPLCAGLLSLAAFRRSSPDPVARRSTGTHRAAVWPSMAAVGLPVVLFVVLIAIPARGQAPAQSTVYLVPGSEADVQALVPQAIWEQLNEMTRPSVPEPVIVGASYEAVATEAAARIEGTFTVWNPPVGSGTLALPLLGGRLLGMRVDDAEGFPTPAGPERYAVALPGPGFRTVRVVFEVPVSAVGADREVRFGGPDVPVCRVGFVTPPDGLRPDVFSRRGAQYVTAAGPAKRVEADHGGGQGVSIRWQTPDRGISPSVSVRSAGVWDVSEAEAVATVGFLVRVEGGSVSRLMFDIPDGLEPGRVTFRPLGGRAMGGLGEWAVEEGPPGWKTVVLRLFAPFTGRAAVTFRLFPREPLTAGLTLRFPRPHAADGGEAVYALRTSGVTAESLERVGLTEAATDSLTREFAIIPELGLDRTPGRTFRPTGSEDPELRLAIRPNVGTAGGATETTWTVGRRAEAEGTVRVVAGDTPVSLVEFDLPNLVSVAEVRGTDVASWGRVGDRVQVWLSKPGREVTIRWFGSLSGYDPTTADGRPVEVNLPAAQVAGSTAALRVRPDEGWNVAPRPNPSFAVAEESEPGAARFLAVSPGALPALVYPPLPVPVHSRESIETSDEGPVYRGDFSIQLRPDRPAAFTFALSDAGQADRADLRGECEEMIGPIPTPTGPMWKLFVPAQTAGPMVMTLTVPLPKDFTRPPSPALWFGPNRVVPTRDEPLRVGWRPPAARPTPAERPHPEPHRESSGRAFLADVTVVSAVQLVAWLAVFAVVVAVAGWGRPGRWGPEQLVGCGLLGVLAPGVTGPAALACGLAAAAGGLTRLTFTIRRLGGLVRR